MTLRPRRVTFRYPCAILRGCRVTFTGDEYDDEIQQQLAMETGATADADGLKTSAAMRPPRSNPSSRSSQVQPLALQAART